jgi:phosphate-selective porin OprO/OprP
MGRWYWAATLAALGVLGAGGTVATAQTAGGPPVDVPILPVLLPPPTPGVLPPPAAVSDLTGGWVAQGARTAAGQAPATTQPMPPTATTPGTATGTPATLPSPTNTGSVSPQPATSGSGGVDPSAPPAPKPLDPNSPILTALWNNGLNFTTPNKDWVVHIGGRFQYETVLWDEPRRLKTSPPGNGGIPAATATSGTGVGSLDDGMFFRRVRLKGDGTAYGVVEFNIEVDFEQLNFITYDHMWAGFKDVPFLGTVRVGQQKVPQGLDSMTSDYHLTFLERNVLSEVIYQDLFAPGILIANDYEKVVTWQTMFHRSQAVVGFFNEDFGDGDYAWTSRATCNPIYANDGEQVLHLAGSFQWRHADLGRTIQPGGTGNAYADTQHDVRFRARPEIRDATGIGSTEILGGDTARFVDTGFLLASNVCTYGSELLWIDGPFSLQGEAGCARVQDARSIYPASQFNRFRGDPIFWGASTQVSYFLTGEHRGYDRRFGVFDRPKVANNFNPKNCADGGEDDCGECANPGWGAFEVAYRYSYLDLNDNGINGGLLSQHTVGLNWYFNDNFKVQINYLNVHRSVVPPARSGTVNGVGALVQFYF